ncbi:growth-regulating factor 6-like isoform X1 [Actinidia eriantha]|uniref:growth-regulating factor 6-like isoform X1 n=1 Tax=Actinidia eriantha TaxID=165200 RepID=UPI002588F4A5|nr:growth-regulating factor 6-like isoform X1 [Actinidia eriantha]XP_057488519.1 growth-regulating factor 6-like isoform X1 [Actinidia eriantha]XP_057488520.1 growth-regulating factor 6-like isoform X1 [Actinidia eriantha]XP_057488521.1 growth-regulating factor 6-like isoform X1 [Actinidia eriantha]XP_057488522.1 growth-regulating factor 6-like isoform X1 [Actinidia eriantha]
MDPVPGRCRRTDGKQWRCSRDVVPNQKYCERHMHRGHSGSRKHVEAFEITSESVPLNLQLATPSSKSSGNPPAATPCSTTSVGHISVSENSVEAKKDLTATAGSPTTSLTIYSKKSESNTNVFGTTTTTITGSRSPADKNSNSRSSNACVGENHASYKNLIYRNNMRSSINNRDNVNTGSSTASGFGFPPENVRRGCAPVGCYSSSLDYNVEETESLRCRRTDGKKWRCNWDVVPDQKYCQRHLHRGAKKLAVVAQSVTVAAVPPPPLPPTSGGRLIPPPVAMPKRAADHHINTNLSISIVEASPVTNEGKRSNSSSSSDATTITDENDSVSHLLTISP